MKKIYSIPIWGTFIILLALLLFIVFSFLTLKTEKVYRADADVEILREKDRVFKIEDVAKEFEVMKAVKGKAVEGMISSGVAELREFPTYKTEEGKLYILEVKNGVVEDATLIKEENIQPVAGGDATR